MERLKYQVVLRLEPENEAYTTRVPTLLGCVTFGMTIAEAFEVIR
jgi:predicted RNase H-like HicB family nuclease